MKVIELVENIKKEKPELFGEMPEKKAAALVREAFAQIGKKLDEMVDQDEVLRIKGLGTFRIRMVEKEKEGRKVSEKRILFRPAKFPSEDAEK
jgi:nucleoid DNA-binding protein